MNQNNSPRPSHPRWLPPVIAFAAVGYIMLAAHTWDVYFSPLPPSALFERASLEKVTGVYERKASLGGRTRIKNYVLAPNGARFFRCDYFPDVPCLPAEKAGTLITVTFAPGDAEFALEIVDAESGKVLRPLSKQSDYLARAETRSALSKNLFWTSSAVLFGLLGFRIYKRRK